MMSVPEPKAAFGWVPCQVAKGPLADVNSLSASCPLYPKIVDVPAPDEGQLQANSSLPGRFSPSTIQGGKWGNTIGP
jgi:hypothetical protein